MIANRYSIEQTASVDRADLIQEGTIGLIIAASKYNTDLQRKAAFSTYAVYWIRAKISRFIQYRSTELESSLNQTVYRNGEQLELLDTLTADYNELCELEDSIYYQQLRAEIRAAMRENLSLKQREILELYYGFDCSRCTYHEIEQILELRNAQAAANSSRKKLRESKWGRLKWLEIKQEGLRF